MTVDTLFIRKKEKRKEKKGKGEKRGKSTEEKFVTNGRWQNNSIVTWYLYSFHL